MGKGSVSLLAFLLSSRTTDASSVYSKGKDKGADKAAAAEEARRKKLERERLLAEEESSMPSKPKANPKAGAKKAAPVKAAPKIPSFESGFADDPQSFSASGIDDALDMLNLVGSRSDKAAIGSQVSFDASCRFILRRSLTFAFHSTPSSCSTTRSIPFSRPPRSRLTPRGATRPLSRRTRRMLFLS